MKFLDLFSGIGGFRLGLEMAGHECVGHVEIDKFANKSYAAMHKPKESEYFAEDIRTVEPDGLPDADCYSGGFPCQAFSIAGSRGGFEDMRGTLVFEIFRLARIKRPSILFLENVKGLLNHDEGRTFATIISAMDELGYDAEWQCINSRNYVPQNRERIFIIGHLRGTSRREVFPIERTDGESNTNSIETVGKWEGTNRHTGQRIYSVDGIYATLTTKEHMNDVPKIAIPVLTPDRLNKRQNGRRFKEDGEPMFTLTGQDRHGVMIQKGRGFNKGGFHKIAPTLTKNSYEHNNHIIDGIRIRRLTPKECFRLQGFPDKYFNRAAEVNSASQLYKQAGNSVTVNVIYEIAKRF